MVAFDFDAALRWARFDPGKTLARRPDESLPFRWLAVTGAGELLLDTCVYIDAFQAKQPAEINVLLKNVFSNHSTVALQEMMHVIGRLNPDHAGTVAVRKQIETAIKKIPDHRLFTPDADVLGRAALLAGILCRLQGYQKDQKFQALNDCVLYLQAVKLGVTVLTANIADFDFLLQLVPAGKVLFYRPDTPADKN